MKKVLLTTVLVPTLSVAMMATPALAFHWNWNNNGDVSVLTNNSAYVSNNVVVTGSTGGNTANGGNGGDGQNGGDGGEGGAILTGSVLAEASVLNKVNRTDTSVSCDCEDRGDVTVETNNRAKVRNNVVVSGDTGGNTANGGDGGTGRRSYSYHHYSRGGGAGDGGAGGYIETGDVLAGASVANYINSTITSL